MGLTAQRVVAGIFTGGVSEAGYQAADKYAKDHGVKGGLNDLETRTNLIKTFEEKPPALPDTPDAFDVALKRRQSAALQMLTGMGRRSTFLGGTLGELSTRGSRLGGF